jgi:hypothetical protein
MEDDRVWRAEGGNPDYEDCRLQLLEEFKRAPKS